MSKQKGTYEAPELHGFFRIQITEDGKGVVGDSGWKENQITNDGVTQYLLNWLAAGSGKSVTHMALGTGGVPASDATTLANEVEKRAAVSSSIIASRTAQFTANFASSASFVTTTMNISNIGLFNTSSGGTLFAGNTFASSAVAQNQSVNATYQIRLS
jgi:hypothetical protein